MSPLRHIAVLVTVHNRVEVTVRGLSQLAKLASSLLDEIRFSVYMVDDGSSDGTSVRVAAIPLDIAITRGTGSLFWNRGMALAYDSARASGDAFDAYMLYNDDVVLQSEFLDFVRAFFSLNRGILVGAFRDPDSEAISYSGYVSDSRIRPFTFQVPPLGDRLVPVDTFNGNLVLIPASVFEFLGGLDPKYSHAYGDIDLGLRAKAIGVPSFVYGSPVGSCKKGTHLDERIRSAKLRHRWRLLFGYPHGPRSHLRFARKHGSPVFFPAYVAGEILRRLAKLLRRRDRRA